MQIVLPALKDFISIQPIHHVLHAVWQPLVVKYAPMQLYVLLAQWAIISLELPVLHAHLNALHAIQPLA
jgi:hypothetical protein